MREARPASAPPFSLTNARVVRPNGTDEMNVVIRDGLIHRVGAAHASTARRVDCNGDFLLPGLIELHTDNIERHVEPRPGSFWETDRAVLAHDAELAACGITTAFDAITLGGDAGSPARQAAHLDAIRSISLAEDSGLLRIDHRLHLRCELSSADLPHLLMRASEYRQAALISLMDHTPGQGQWRDLERFRSHYARRYGLGDVQLDEIIERRKAARTRFAHDNRQTALQFAARHSCVLAGHDASTEEDIAESHAARCSIAEFPTSIEAARAARAAGMHAIAGAPNLVRGGSHSGNVAAADLARERLIDVLSSDYCPSSLLHGVYVLARLFDIPLHIAAATVTSTPAKALNLRDRGSIEEGLRADLIRVRDTPLGPVIVAVWSAGRQVA